MKKLTIILVAALIFISCTSKNKSTTSNTDSTYIDTSIDAKMEKSIDSIFALDSIK